jgi:hypothetical protein
MGINTSPYQNGDPRIGLGIVQSLTHTNMGFIPIWGPTELIPKLERHSKWGPHIGMGIPISVWVGICQYSKSGSPHTNIMGFIPIWGPTYIPHPLPITTATPKGEDHQIPLQGSIGVCGCFWGLGATLATVPAFWGIYFPLYEVSE